MKRPTSPGQFEQPLAPREPISNQSLFHVNMTSKTTTKMTKGQETFQETRTSIGYGRITQNESGSIF